MENHPRKAPFTESTAANLNWMLTYCSTSSKQIKFKNKTKPIIANSYLNKMTHLRSAKLQEIPRSTLIKINLYITCKFFFNRSNIAQYKSAKSPLNIHLENKGLLPRTKFNFLWAFNILWTSVIAFNPRSNHK